MKPQKILIVSNFFAPENTPRAFRVTALVERLVERGTKVCLVLPNKEIYHNNPTVKHGLEIVYAQSPLEKASVNLTRKTSGGFLPKFLREAILFFLSHEYFIKYDKGIEKVLLELDDQFDLVLSVSYPVAIHRAVAKAIKKNKKLKYKVLAAEFSDPAFRNEYWRAIFFYYKKVMRSWAKLFDYFIIPTNVALDCYTPFMAADKVKIIPQGFDLNAFEHRQYKPHAIPTFAYAGRFYEKIRDPEFLFKYLCSLEADYRFELYVNVCDQKFDAMIDKYVALSGSRIVRCEPLPREKLISHLSTLDFLINLEYTNGDASPIKLIDYGMSSRPIISFKQQNFDRSKFHSFFSGDYSHATKIDMSAYDIDTVVDQFLDLI